MSIAVNMVLSLSSSLMINSQVNPNNDLRTLLIISLVNAIVVPLITTLGIKLKGLLRKFGFKDKEILLIEISAKKVIENELVNLKEKAVIDGNEILYQEIKKQLVRVRKDITQLELDLEREE